MSNANPVIYVVSDELAKVSSLLPSNKNRSLAVHSLVKAFRLLSPDASGKVKHLQVVRPIRATYKDLALYHTREYLDHALIARSPSNSNAEDQSIQQEDDDSEFGLEDDCPPFYGLHEYIPLVAGATLTAVTMLKENKANSAICWDGGRHHAEKSHASGYCYVADCVLALLALKRPAGLLRDLSSLQVFPLKKPRVMYLDLDLHFSDAVSQAFYSTNAVNVSQVLTLSIHHAAPGFFPSSPLASLPSIDSPEFDPFTLSIPLSLGASNRTFARIWPVVHRIQSLFQPDFVVVQCGVDGLAGDPCAAWNWCLDGEGSISWYIRRIVTEWRGKKLFLGGGGYDCANAARAWAYLTSVIIGQPLSLGMAIPEHSAFPLYAPSFTLDVPAGNMQDQNSEEHLQTIETCFEKVLSVLHQKLAPSI